MKKWKFALYMTLGFALSSCKGGSSGSLDDLAGGDLSDVDRVQITQFLPNTTTVTVEQAATQTFFITAVAPPAHTLTYSWVLDGSSVQSGSSASYSITGALSNTGSHTLKVTASDGQTDDSQTWTVKVNGPPVLTAVTTGTPLVSVDDTVNISATATDPNSDTLTYTWTLNGLPSAYLVGSTGTAVLTGHASIAGSNNVTLTVSDGTATDTYTWTAEVNYFPSACNTLSQDQICTFAGSPSIGDGLSPGTSQQGIRVGGIASTVDDLDNIIIADYYNHVIWYWNRSGADLTRFNVSVPAGQLKVIAGTGEAASGADGLAIQSSIYYPRGVAFDSANQHLYVSEWNGHKVKRINSSGIVSTFMGGGTSNTDGGVTYSQRCTNPAGIQLYNNKVYVACYGLHRVKEADLTTGLTNTVVGNGSTGLSGNGTALPGVVQNPYGIFVNADGIYVTAYAHHRIMYANTSASTKTFWGGSISALAGKIYRIIGDGTAGQNTGVIPTSLKIATPTSIIVKGNDFFFSAIDSSRDGIYVANNSGGLQTYGNHSVADGIGQRLTYHSGGNNMAGYNGSGVSHELAKVSDPYDLFYDSTNNDIVFSDYSNRRIRKLDLDDYKIHDLVGSGQLRYGNVGDTALPSTDHLFNSLSSVAYETSSRTLFFADNNNYRIRKVTAYGEVSTAMGRGAGDPTIDNDIPSNVLLRTNSSGNAYIAGLASFSDGLLVQVNSQGHNVRAWNRTGSDGTFFGQYILDNSVSTIAGDYLLGAGDGPVGPATSAQLRYPTGVVGTGTGASRILYIADQLNHCIRKVDNTGALTTVVGVCGDNSAGASNSATLLTAVLNRPNQIALDTNGNLLIADTYNHKIRYANLSGASVTVANVSIPAGQIATIACNNGTTGSSSEDVLSIGARCNYPYGVDVSGDEICFSNTGRHNVRCFKVSTGLIRTVAGSFEATPYAGSPVNYSTEGVAGTSARLYSPKSVSFDNNGDLFIADQNNHIIRKVKLSP